MRIKPADYLNCWNTSKPDGTPRKLDERGEAEEVRVDSENRAEGKK